MNGPTGRSASERSRLVADGQKSQKDLGSWGCSWWSSCNGFDGVNGVVKILFVPFYVLCAHKFPILPDTSALTGGTWAKKPRKSNQKQLHVSIRYGKPTQGLHIWNMLLAYFRVCIRLLA